MTKLSGFTLVLGMFISVGCISQNSNEIGIGGTIDSDQRIFLNYKLALKDNRSLNFRLSQGWFKDEDFGGSRFFSDSATSETKYESNYITNRIWQSKLTIGPEFQIKESNFSWGLEGILGYRSETRSILTNTHDVVYSNIVPNNMLIVLPYISSLVSTFYKREYLTTGVQGRFSLKALATNRLGLKLFGEIGLEYNIRLTDITEYAVEPVPITDLPEADVVFTFPKNFFIPKFRFGASIYLNHYR
jgi:hypothetical protein